MKRPTPINYIKLGRKSNGNLITLIVFDRRTVGLLKCLISTGIRGYTSQADVDQLGQMCIVLCWTHYNKYGPFPKLWPVHARVWTLYNGIYAEALPERGTFFRFQVYERVGISLVDVYETVGTSFHSVIRSQKGYKMRISWLWNVEKTFWFSVFYIFKLPSPLPTSNLGDISYWGNLCEDLCILKENPEGAHYLFHTMQAVGCIVLKYLNNEISWVVPCHATTSFT